MFVTLKTLSMTQKRWFQQIAICKTKQHTSKHSNKLGFCVHREIIEFNAKKNGKRRIKSQTRINIPRNGMVLNGYCCRVYKLYTDTQRSALSQAHSIWAMDYKLLRKCTSIYQEMIKTYLWFWNTRARTHRDTIVMSKHWIRHFK